MTTALLLIDLQAEFLSHGGNFLISATSRLALLRNTAKVVRSFRVREEPIIWVRSEYALRSTQPLGNLLEGTHSGKKPCCAPNTEGAEFPVEVQALQAPDDVLLTKGWYSAFKETNLEELLRQRGITHLFIGGLLTNVCVSATAEDAVKSCGLTVTILEDCLGWRKFRSHEMALSKMRAAGVIVSTQYKALGTPAHQPTLYYGIAFVPMRLRVMCDPKETRTPPFLGLNHRGKTPVLVDPQEGGDIIVNESIAILHYIDTYFEPKQTLLPSISARRAYSVALTRIQETENLHSIYDELEDAHFNAENSGKPLETAERAKLIDCVYKELDFWETYAKQTLFISGNEFGLADCAFFPLLAYMVHRGFEWTARWQNLHNYFLRVRERNCAQHAQPLGWDQPGKTNVWANTT
ncbi:hypothetical protein MIND_00225500 [Mycena indigotica]|uniref:GST C-terminal domain-containing protein n=1 Tax=Mycena indigotica TaxID=2126181 RepID=A0A8H6T8F6_9AGAR|nr:uncharacterized protein MIND_00225500 [Mycena indigotica]KAF7312131.1 hypothetical protein MIND_00225500 [Mycena indigotica]